VNNETSSLPPLLRRTIVGIGLAQSVQAASRLAVSTLWKTAGPILVPPVVVVDATSRISGSDDFGRCVVHLLTLDIPDVRRVVPDQPLASLLRRRTPVHVGSRAERISIVRLPDSIVRANAIVGVNDVRRETGARPTLAIGIWSRFAGPRERLGARLGTLEQGLAAEIALAFQPAVILLADTWRGLTVVVATSDQVAAELVGLAVRGTDGDEQIGPWQDPLVQRATELNLGVLLPDRIAIRIATPNSTPKDRATTILTEIAGRLGVRDAALSAE
jgi:hypothetical protein